MEPETNMNPEIKAEVPEVTPADVAAAEQAVDAVAAEKAADVMAAEKVSQPMSINTESGTLSKLPPAQSSTNQQWRAYGEQVSQILAGFPERFGEVFEEYKQPITTVGIALAAVPFVILTVAILKVVNAIPFFAPTFELIGFGYSAWFVYRYLLFAETRKELGQDFDSLKTQVTGKKEI